MKGSPNATESVTGALILLAVLLTISFVSVTLPDASAREQDLERATGEDSTAIQTPTDSLPKPPRVFDHRAQPWIGDFDGMVERRVVRALVVYNATSFFFDEEGQPRGFSYEAMKRFEGAINKKLGSRSLGVLVIQIPVRPDQLVPLLREGYGDLAVAPLTITGERKEPVDFSEPILSGVREIVVSGPEAAPINTLEDLAGREVWVRESSSYFESLEKINVKFETEGLAPIRIRKAQEQLETEDLLEMVATGLLEITIADDYIARAWAGILNELRLHPDIALRTRGDIAWLFRKSSPKLAAEVNAFIHENRKGTLQSDVLMKRYYANSKWIRNATTKYEFALFKETVGYFKKYSNQYNFDWLMIADQGYQESRLNQDLVSPAGAIGVMQLLPSTASDPAVSIPDIHLLENNIHAGHKYMRFIITQYFADADLDPLNQHLFAFASYNAGPNRIRRLRKKAEEQGFDPNVWFQNVEVVVAREVGREPVQYVSNIFKYYLAYSLAREELD